jgi:prevent-host-death family protein
MSTFNISEAKARFSELVQKALHGEEVIIAKDNRPVVKLVPLTKPKRPRKPGSGKRDVVHIAKDFDATPSDFADHV